MTAALGRLESVPLRQVWPHEANDFTPWLAEAENLVLLAETLNLGDLQLEGTEVNVGNFNLDILARDIEGRIVLIENQFGPTDHTLSWTIADVPCRSARERHCHLDCGKVPRGTPRRNRLVERQHY